MNDFKSPNIKKDASFSLVFFNHDKNSHWIINLWSNQVNSGDVSQSALVKYNENYGLFKFQVLDGEWKREKKGFYKHERASVVQRKMAIEEFEKQIAEKMSKGFTLILDSRILEEELKTKKASVKKKIVSKSALSKMSPGKQLNYWGTRDYIFDRKKFKEVIELIRSKDKKFPTYQSIKDIVSSDNALSSEFDFPNNYNELLDRDRSEPVFTFDLLLVFKQAISEKPSVLTLNGNIGDRSFEDGQQLLVHGDVHVKGNLEIGVSLYITGDLIVDGVIEDTEEWTPFLVGGNIKAKGMSVGGTIYCAGNIEADCICIDGTGSIRAGKKLYSALLIEEGYDHDIEANLNVDNHIDFSDSDKEEGVNKTIELLVGEISEKIKERWKKDNEHFYFDKDWIFDSMKKGVNIWK